MQSLVKSHEYGEVIFDLEPDDKIFLRLIYVDPSCRRMGFGTALLKELILLSNQVQLPIHIETQPTKSQDFLRPFYQKHGFTAAGPHHWLPTMRREPVRIPRLQLISG